MQSNNFSDIGINAQFCRALEANDIHSPTDIQHRAIPALLDGQDVLGIAQTGTGKTLAFGLPLMQLLDGRKAQSRSPLAVILAPTRELASQIHSELRMYSRHTTLRVACIFGGVKQGAQVRNLQQGVDILVATPGRLLDLMNQGFLKLDKVTHLVLDEADRLLDLGFARDIKRVATAVPKKRHTLLFSATMPKEVEQLAQNLLFKPERIDVAPKQVTVEKIEQRVSFVEKNAKQGALVHLLNRTEVEKAIVFTRTKHGADRVAKKLNATNIVADAIHGNKSQNARTRALADFTSGRSWVLVATDIAARGIDISGVSHVINFELPPDPESYVHRIGRTGRAGAAGVAWSLVDASERGSLRTIERRIRHSPTTVELTFSAEEKAAHRAESERIARARAQQQNSGPQRKKSSQSAAAAESATAPSRKRRRNRRRKVGQISSRVA